VLNHRSGVSTLKAIDGQSVGGSPLVFYVSPGDHIYTIELHRKNLIKWLGGSRYEILPSGSKLRGLSYEALKRSLGATLAIRSGQGKLRIRAEAGQSIRLIDINMLVPGMAFYRSEFSWEDGTPFPVEEFVKPDISDNAVEISSDDPGSRKRDE